MFESKLKIIITLCIYKRFLSLDPHGFPYNIVDFKMCFVQEEISSPVKLKKKIRCL